MASGYIDFSVYGIPNLIPVDQALYTTRAGDFGTVTRTGATTLTCTKTPPQLGTMTGDQFIGVIMFRHEATPVAFLVTDPEVGFTWNHGALTLTLTGGKEFPAGWEVYDIIAVGIPRDTATAQDGLIVNEVNQAVATYTTTFNLNADKFNTFELWVDTLTNSTVTIQAERPATSPATYEEATLPYLGVTIINTTGVKKCDIPMLADTIQISWTISNAANATKIYLARGVRS